MYEYPGVFNVLDYGMLDDSNMSSSPSGNAIGLQATIDAATQAGGGTILIPTGTYSVEGPIYIGQSSPCETASLRLVGTSGNTHLIQTAPDLSPPDISDFFLVDINCGNNDDVGGVLFEDLHISYKDGMTSGTAIKVGSVTGAQNVKIVRCVLTNCPNAVSFINTLQCGIFESTINYTEAVAGNFQPLAVQLGDDFSGNSANETIISGTVIESISVNKDPNHGPGGTALLIYHADQIRVVNVRIEAFEAGIVIIPGGSGDATHGTVNHGYFENVTAFTGTNTESILPYAGPGLIIQPQGDQYVSELVFIACTFQPGADNPTAYTGGGIFIDQSETTGVVDQLRFVSCYSCGWPGPGLEVTSGSNIEILGGYFSCNGSQSSPPTLSAGIALTVPANVRIIGVGCTNSCTDPVDGSPFSATQEYGIYVDLGGASNILVEGCDLTGNLDSAVHVGALASGVFIRDCNVSDYTTPLDIAGTATNVQATNCAGYNDQGTVVHSTIPASATSFSASGYGYYGPVEFYTIATSGNSISQIKVNSTDTFLKTGSFYLAPGETAQISHGGLSGTPDFVMIGK